MVTSLEDKRVEFNHNTYYLRRPQQVLNEKPLTIPTVNQELKEVTDALGPMKKEEDNLSNMGINSNSNFHSEAKKVICTKIHTPIFDPEDPVKKKKIAE